jgi:hypothetical protein
VSVHSSRLGAVASSTTTYTTIYTTPAAVRTILKSLVCTNLGSAATVVHVLLSAGGTLYAHWTINVAAYKASGGCVIFSPWTVLNAGDTIQVASDAANVNVVASGTELDL